jgi:hypothetical protein
MTKKLIVSVSQDCETKHGRYSVSAREISVEFSNEDSLGIVVGTLVDQFFDVVDVQRKYKRLPYKLNKPIQLSISFSDDNASFDADAGKLRDQFTQGVRISGKGGIKNFASFMVDLLFAVVKSKSGTKIDVASILDDNYVRTTSRSVCDSPMGEFMTIVSKN